MQMIQCHPQTVLDLQGDNRKQGGSQLDHKSTCFQVSFLGLSLGLTLGLGLRLGNS